MKDRDVWILQITDTIDGLTKRTNCISKNSIAINEITNFASLKGFDETNISGAQLVKTYLERQTLDINGKVIDENLKNLLIQIESLGLYPSITYTYRKGVNLKIKYFQPFSSDVPYFLTKAKEIFYPNSIHLQEVFGADSVNLYELWASEYKRWITKSNKSYLQETFNETSTTITSNINRI